MRQVPSVAPVHSHSRVGSLVAGRRKAGGCAFRLCRSPPPPLANSPCSPLACLHFHPDHVLYPYPNPNPSIQIPNPNPRSMFTVYVYLEVHTHIHTHVHRAHLGNTSNRQTLPSPFPFPSPPSQPLTGLDWTRTWTGTCSIQSWTRDAVLHRRHQAHSSIVFPATARRAPGPARSRPRPRPRPRPRARARGRRPPSRNHDQDEFGARDDITPQTMSFPARHRQLLPRSLHTLATTAH